MSLSREFNNTVFTSIDTEFVVSLARLYQLLTRFFTFSRKAANSTPSCAWTSLLSCSISFRILFNFFFGVPAMIVVTVMIELGVCNPVVDPNWVSPLQRDCFVVVVQNLGLGDLIHVMLRRIRAISHFGFLIVLLSCVEIAPTCS